MPAEAIAVQTGWNACQH